nr:MAG TPA: hypothetical protein [Caudoviricetes sp.]
MFTMKDYFTKRDWTCEVRIDIHGTSFKLF